MSSRSIEFSNNILERDVAQMSGFMSLVPTESRARSAAIGSVVGLTIIAIILILGTLVSNRLAHDLTDR